MAETLTPHYSWTKPDIGGDATTWGNVLNQTIDAVDSVVWANQQAGLPIGSVSMFAGATAPSNWLICDGSSLPTTGGIYDGLFAAIGYAYGGSGANFNLPNLVQNFPLGAGTNPIGTVGGAATVTLDTTMLPAHAHPIADHTHSASQVAHTHSASQDAHAHSIPYSLVNTAASGLTNGGASFGLAGGQGTDNRQPAVHVDTQQPGITVNLAGLVATLSAGSGVAHNNMPPFVAINFIVRYK